MVQWWRIFLLTQETQIPSLCWENSLEKGTAPHSSIPAWRIPRTEGQRVGHDWVRSTFTFTVKTHTVQVHNYFPPIIKTSCFSLLILEYRLLPRPYHHVMSHLVTQSCVSDFATPWTLACQATLFMEFSRQEYWSQLPVPSPGDLPDWGTELGSHTAGRFFAIWATISSYIPKFPNC